jgi:hypothetical protein
MHLVMRTPESHRSDTDVGMTMLELLVSEALGDEGAVTEVIRPAAIVPEAATRSILLELTLRDVRTDGVWLAEPTVWRRFSERPHGSAAAPDLIGSIQVAYGTPTRYEITIYRVTVTGLGTERGWTVSTLCDEALQYGGLTLADCPRAELSTPPRPLRMSRSVAPIAD